MEAIDRVTIAVSDNTTTQELVELLRSNSLHSIASVVEDSELDGLTIRTLNDGDIFKLLPEKIGHAKKLTLIVDGLKAKFIAENQCLESVSASVNIVDLETEPESSSLPSMSSPSFRSMSMTPPPQSKLRSITPPSASRSGTPTNLQPMTPPTSGSGTPTNLQPMTPPTSQSGIPTNLQPMTPSTSQSATPPTSFQPMTPSTSRSEPSSTNPIQKDIIRIEDITAFIPNYSSIIQNLLDQGTVLKEWDKFVEETAYHILATGTFDSKEFYSQLGRILYTKYPCIGFSSGRQPWSHFISRLSQKIRNIRWKWNKRGKQVGADEPPKKKKGPRTFVGFVSNEENDDNTLDEDSMLKMMKEELAKPKKEQNKALLLKIQRDTFKSRREYISSVVDGRMTSILEKYPILQIPEFIAREYHLMTGTSKSTLADRWTNMLQTLDTIFGTSQDSDDENDKDGEQEVLALIRKVEEKVKFRTTKKEEELIMKVDAKRQNLSSKPSSPPRLVVLKNDDNSINNIYIVGNGIKIEVGKDVKSSIELLVMNYYVHDLTYPKCYQLLGFLQTYLLKDNAPFHKGANYIKFEKEMETNTKEMTQNV